MKNRVGWMFWGCFADSEKGLFLFWEEWEFIDSQKICEKIVPLLDGMVSIRPWLSIMQDNTPAHAAASTMEEMSQGLIQPIFWRPTSPDLNPLEAFWDRKKDYIQRHNPNLRGGKQRTQDIPRQILKEAQDSVSLKDLVRLIERMPARCQAVVDLDGRPTIYQGLEIFQRYFQIKGQCKTVGL